MIYDRNVAWIYKTLWAFDSLLENVDAPVVYQQQNILNIGETKDWQKNYTIWPMYTQRSRQPYTSLYTKDEMLERAAKPRGFTKQQ